MREILFLYCKTIRIIFQLLFCLKQKVILIGYPTHTNLGDQAQLYCTYKWIKETYPEGKIITVPFHCYHEGNARYITIALWSIAFSIIFFVLKLTIHKKDIFIGHSGYYLIDHHGGWTKFVYVAKRFSKNKFLILPQTLNMYNPYFTQEISKTFNSNKNLTLLLRDEVSYEKAQHIFPKTKLMLYPDIVTSLIGTKHYNYKREGILFCMRNDIEMYYSKDAISKLRSRFNCKTDITDTTINVSESKMRKNREKLIFMKIDDFAHYKLIITDRYHGTIFSQISATPAIIINSADHKLYSGVKWFPQDQFAGHIYFANDLEEAYNLAQDILQNKNIQYSTPTYFKDKYWNKLSKLVK